MSETEAASKPLPQEKPSWSTKTSMANVVLLAVMECWPQFKAWISEKPETMMLLMIFMNMLIHEIERHLYKSGKEEKCQSG